MEKVLLSANTNNIEACVELAVAHRLGIEVMAFAFPQTLEGDWKATLREYKTRLATVPGVITMHGPFMDMSPGSPDPRINAICHDRYHHAIQIASELSAQTIVFHANFIAAIHSMSYRQTWHASNVEFWTKMADYAAEYGIAIAVENMWEFDPDIIIDVVAEVNHPHLRACLDVGHAHIYGPDYNFETWLRTFQPWLIHVHMNNTHGKLDTHNALNDGIINYDNILSQLRRLHPIPTMTLEMYEVHQMRESLPFFNLPPEPDETQIARSVREEDR